MATVYSNNYSTGTYTYTRVRVDYSGTSATATLLYTRTNTWSGSTGQLGTFTFGGVSTSYNKYFSGQQTDATVASVTFTISTAGGTYSGTSTSSSSDHYLDFSGSVSIPAQATAPTGLALSNVSSTYNSVTGTVSVTGWGGAGDASTRYRNLSVMKTADKETSERRYQRVYGNTMSSAITVDNSTTYGTMNLVANTKYWLWWYATNGTLDTSSPSTSTTTVYTRPAPLYTKSASVASTTSIKVNYSTAADGGAYSKKIQYSLDGTNWSDGATVSSASATSGNFTITGLTPGTAYTIRLRTSTTAGTTSSGNVTATTYKVPNTPTTSATTGSVSSNSVTYGTTTFNNPNTGTVYLYGGTSASPTTQLTTKTTTGNSTYSHTNLAANTEYYYRSRAKNTGGWSSYSSDATATTLPAAPTVAVSSLTPTSATISYSTAADGGAYSKTFAYSTDNGSTWTTLTTSSGTAAVNGTFTLSGLTSGNTYTVKVRSVTTAGTSVSTLTFVTVLVQNKLYGSDSNDETARITNLYGSPNGTTRKIAKLYGSVGGVAKLLYEKQGD